MTATSVLRVRVDDKLRAETEAVLDTIGLSVADAVRILFRRIADDQSHPLAPVQPDGR